MMVEHSDTLHQVVTAVADTAHAASGHEAMTPGEIFGHLLKHLQNSNELALPFVGNVELPKFPPIHIGGVAIDLSITKHVVFLLFCGMLLTVSAILAARAYRKSLVPRGFVNLLETVVSFVIDDIALPSMGKAGMKYVPYLLTTFFYILLMNLIGLVPYGATATGNIMVTAGLAIVAFVMIQFSAIRAQGMKHYLAHLTGGVPWPLWPIMIPIEFLSLFTKPFALCIRLFANMTGGHIVVVSLIGLIFVFHSYLIAPAPLILVIGIDMLELLVAFIQAYVFTTLTALFMGIGIPSEEHSEGH
ncbi:MAG TPA: F0F1 ATP synthase subunit A [Bacteroidota bacterium]|nr:F0F1 ATP synthase subunit A [Bacteroidota bacterium]